MISRISGKITVKDEGTLLVEAGGIWYEVMVPVAVMKSIEQGVPAGKTTDLVTYHYFQMTQSSGVPVLIGFQNEVEKEFFEKFISVSGIGPKAACRALVEPFSAIAGAIDSGDEPFLRKLPGIGARKAAEIIAKLKGRVGKYGLIKDGFMPAVTVDEDIRQEALEVLFQLQYKKTEAEVMIDKAIKRNPDISTGEELLNEVYRERKASS